MMYYLQSVVTFMTFGLLIKYGCQYTYDAKHAQVIIDAILSIELCNITATS